MSLYWGIPFLGLLASIALGQTMFPNGWLRNYGKVTTFWIAMVIFSLEVREGKATLIPVVRLLILDYLPFVISILAFYVISGGLHLRTRMSGLPRENTILLALGTILSGILGTPGTTLLFLRLTLAANRWRRYKAHTLVFLIMLVANIGGALTPLGPPLLLGYLKGVSFVWTIKAMLLPTLSISALLIVVYYALDSLILFKREDVAARLSHRKEHDVIIVHGKRNLVLLSAAIFLQIICGSWKGPVEIRLPMLSLPLSDLIRVMGLLGLTLISLRWTPKQVRKINHFTWGPMKEVAILFAGIFVTVSPLLSILESGTNGAMGGLIRMVTDSGGHPINWAYFVATGMLSSVLDNAPAFLVYFDVAGGDPSTLMGAKATTLVAISAGAVFWGGLTYIGNGPNFMVRSIAQEQNVAMPSFFTYMGWSGAVLLPSLSVIAWIFFI
jgi:Na+/H+ antiporter NhaD/arsenite permease-like protein